MDCKVVYASGRIAYRLRCHSVARWQRDSCCCWSRRSTNAQCIQGHAYHVSL